MELVKKIRGKTIEVRDVIHGSIELYPWEMDIIDSRFFQRLRLIKQLGFAEFAYPCATHNRYIHSIGACHLAGITFQAIFKNHFFSSQEVYQHYYYLARVSALLHDIGHGPFSHAIEFAMPNADEMQLPTEVLGKKKNRQATHEDYTLKIILESSLTPVLEKGLGKFGIEPQHIANVMNLSLSDHNNFFFDKGVNFRKVLHQIISSELDADRMDYLQRDSYYSGVSYGTFDSHWLLSNLSCYIDPKSKIAHLALSDRAIYTFEDFLLSRYHMFLMVYLHHKSVIYEEMLRRYIESPDCNFSVPADVEKYAELDDSALYTALKADAKNPWAKRILEKRTYKVALEIHGSTKKDPLHDPRVKEITEKLRDKKIDFIATSSGKALSNYVKPNLGNLPLESKDPEINENTIFVESNDRMSPTKIVPLESYTDLFRKYGEAKNIVRIYVPENSKF